MHGGGALDPWYTPDAATSIHTYHNPDASQSSCPASWFSMDVAIGELSAATELAVLGGNINMGSNTLNVGCPSVSGLEHHFLDGIPSVLTDPATPAAVVGVYNHISCPNDKQQQCENVHYCNYNRVE